MQTKCISEFCGVTPLAYSTGEYQISGSSYNLFFLEPLSSLQQQSQVLIYSQPNTPDPAHSQIQELLSLPDTVSLASQPQLQYQVVSNPIALDSGLSSPSIQLIIQSIDLFSHSPLPRLEENHPMPSSQIHSGTTSEQIPRSSNNTTQHSQNASAKWRFPRPEEDPEEDTSLTKKETVTTLGDAISLLSEKKYHFLKSQLEQ